MFNRRKFYVSVILIIFFAFAAYVFYIMEQDNFHTVTPGEAYRSAQFDGEKLTYYIRRYNIRSILNLRGANPDSVWYREELRVSAANRINHYDVTLTSTKEPTRNDVKRLIEIFKSAPKPILIHCQSGADRTGVVAAMWKVIVDHESKSEAEKQLSIFYGHIPLGGRYAMDKFFEKWQPSN